MYRSTIRWTTAAAAAALIALPVAGAAAQSTGTTPPAQTQQPPAPQPQPQPQPQPDPQPQPEPQPATTAQQPTTAEQAQPGQVDATAAKKHLSEARDALSQITSMPAAAKLQGDNRTQVSQLISNFNELITTQANWRNAYSKVDANLNALLGPEGSDPAAATAGTSGTTGSTGTAGTAGTTETAGSTGTSGATAATTSLDPSIRAKLAEFRSHLKLFEKAAGGGEAASGAMAPSAATASTSNPANPAPTATGTPANPDPGTPAQPPSSAGATGTSGVTTSPTGTMAPADQAKAAAEVGHSEADKHLDAIDDILAKSKTGTLTKAQTSELKKHVEQLRALLKQNR